MRSTDDCPSPGDDQPSPVPAALRPFAGQRRPAHLAFVLVGVAGWSGAFLAVLALAGGEGVATADAPAALAARQRAGVLASALVGAYFGAGSARERGGPVSNLLYAPLAAAVGATGLPVLAVHGAAPRGVFASPGTAGSIAWGGVGELAVLATAAAVAGGVAAVHYAVVAGPARRARFRERFGALPGVHLGPDPLGDWRSDGDRDRRVDPGGVVGDGDADGRVVDADARRSDESLEGADD